MDSGTLVAAFQPQPPNHGKTDETERDDPHDGRHDGESSHGNVSVDCGGDLRNEGRTETGISRAEQTEAARNRIHHLSLQHFERSLEVKDRFGMDLTHTRLCDFQNSADLFHRQLFIIVQGKHEPFLLR